MYNGLKTVFYDGTNLFIPRGSLVNGRRLNVLDNVTVVVFKFKNGRSSESVHDSEERRSWEQVFVEDHVKEIPDLAFYRCNIESVIITDNSKLERISRFAFARNRISSLRLPTTLRYIAPGAFAKNNLSSVFIPPGCERMHVNAFKGNGNLEILHVTEGTEPILLTMMYRDRMVPTFRYLLEDCIERNQNEGEEYSLHRVCASFQPSLGAIVAIVKEKGLRAFQEENEIGITPSRYLQENPYTGDVTEKKIFSRYILTMMGEVE